MRNQTDTLIEFEKNEKGLEITFIVIICIYSLLILCAFIYIFWLFKKILSNLIFDPEAQILLCIHILCPMVGLLLFVTKKKLGWSITLLCSILNVTYAIVLYLTELKLDIAILYFLTHALLIVLFYQKSLIETVNISRRWFMATTYFSLTIGLIFLILLITT